MINALIGGQGRRARKAKRLTQAALGRSIGVSFQQIQKYENGKNRIASVTLLQCSIILNKPMCYFCRDAKATLTGKPFISPPIPPSTMEQEEADIYKYGLIIQNIDDLTFRNHLISLAKRHLKLMKAKSE